ncbi:hypothetical protein M0805_007549 [Coniferiporia weirii]|nr:hypothetical protein M0805_007549 [Coniferiporia weirii]
MFETYQRSFRRRTQTRLRFLLSLLVFAVVIGTSDAQQNVTLDDTDLYIVYSPAISWHASTVPCASCLMPANGTAFGGTWHDGTHVVSTVDEDDEGDTGDTDGDGTTTSSATKLTASSSSSAEPTQTANDDDDDDKGGKGKDGDGKRRFRRTMSPHSVSQSRGLKRDENPFEVQEGDSDDPGSQDVPVTATLNFSGTAIYLFAIMPLFPAPPNTTPTTTNLSFTLDGTPRGQLLFQPDATKAGTPTVNSTTAEKFLPGVSVFSSSGLDDMAHSLVVNVGADSVFLFDYAVYTAGASDSVSSTTTAPGSQRTESSNNVDDSSSKHNVATFAGAVGGSVGLLSVLAFGLCISIRYRRRRARQRERRDHGAFAETFTARDHGAFGPDDDEEGSVFRRRSGVGAQPIMSQAGPALFVPRYFPGSTPASPPPYVAESPPVPVHDPSLLITSINRAGLPVAIPSAPPAGITLPTPTLNLQRTSTGNYSYADRPPPTPPDEESRLTFTVGGEGQERIFNGGIIGPLPMDSPAAEGCDPMLGLDFDEERNNEQRALGLRDSNSEVPSSDAPCSSSGHSQESGSSAGAGAAPSLTYTSHGSTSTRITPSTFQTSMPSTDGSDSMLAPPGLYPTLNTSTSLPSLSSSRPLHLSSPSQPNLVNPNSSDSPTTIAYPLLRPSRVPLPPSIYASDFESQESLARHDSRI